MTRSLRAATAAVFATCLLAGCSGGTQTLGSNAGGGGGGSTEGRVFKIVPGDAATAQMAAAMTLAAPGDTIEFACGFFDLTTTLQLINTEDVLIKGCGIDKTVLSFRGNNLPEGILAVNVGGLTIQDLTILDTGGNGIELRSVNHGTIRRVRTIWSSGGGRESATPITKDNFAANNYRLLRVPCTDPPTENPDVPENFLGDTTSDDYTVSAKAGRYGIYPVSSENILIEEAESIGASDAGIYVGQTNNAIIKRSRAAYNVFGFEIENVQGGEYAYNLAECNTGGFLVYDLDGLRQYGDRSRMYGNKAINNNTYNFTAGGFVANVPPGSGMITLSYDRIDIFDNEFRDNNTGGIIHASYELFPEGAGRPTEKRIDFYTEGVHIFRNKFSNNGNALPRPTTTDLADNNLARLLPPVVGLKNQAACAIPTNIGICAPLMGNTYRGAHIVWDGLLDSLDEDCPYPKDKNGNPVRADARGKPQHSNEDPDPSCHYNAYKFKTTAPRDRIVPAWWASCIDSTNEFAPDSIAFSNFNGLKGLNGVLALSEGEPPTEEQMAEIEQFPASFDMSKHDCATAYGSTLPLLAPVVIPEFERTGTYDPAPTEAQVEALCNKATATGAVNFDAAAVNCPRLDQYHLFANPQDPTSAPNGNGVPFSMNSKLFSDYSVKYRVAYLPPGQTATYDVSRANSTYVFPVGTIIAKTFSFRSGSTETPIETRLLIKRRNSKGNVRWDGVPYIWATENGARIARLALTGGTADVSWDYTDVDSGTRYTGRTDRYLIPNINQCISCHTGTDKEPGASPIGLKVRNLNGKYRSESPAATAQAAHPVRNANQVQYWCDNGLLAGCPTAAQLAVNAAGVATGVERVPVFNKPGDSGFAADSDQDIESRARAWLEVNCAYCHNDYGFAASTGLYLDTRRPVDAKFGICKEVTAAGAQGTGGRTVDIHPGDAGKSVMEFRISSAATTAAARMPPLARSVVDEAGHALVAQWINDVVEADEAKYPGSTACTGDSGGLPFPLPPLALP